MINITCNNFIKLMENGIVKTSAIGTNCIENFFSVVRSHCKYPFALNYCQIAAWSWWMLQIIHCNEDERGFSIPEVSKNKHYNDLDINLEYPSIEQKAENNTKKNSEILKQVKIKLQNYKHR
jgi:hypothetical protein